MILRSPHPDVLLPDVTFSEFVLNCIRKHGDGVAIIDVDDNGRKYTFDVIYQQMLKCAAALSNLGVKKGDVVAVAIGNRPIFPVIVVATAACGGMITTCNPNFTKDEIVKQFAHSEPSIAFVECDKVETMEEVAKQVKSITHIFTTEDHKSMKSIFDLISEATQKDFPLHAKLDAKETFYIPYSSGTTGFPKGVMLTQSNMTAILSLLGVAFQMSKKDCFWTGMPFFHIYGILMVFLQLVQGVKNVIQKRFNVELFLQCIENYKVTRLSVVPAMALAIHNSPLLSKYDTSSLKHIQSGAAPLPDLVGKELMRMLKVNFVQAYGLTEAVPICFSMDDQVPIQSVGKVMQNTLLKIVSTNSGVDLDCGETGEICMKGPQLMKGYYKNPDATRSCIDVDGWFHTGDIGYFDKYGHVFIVDRLKELIKVKGFQVAPSELEEVLLHHPNITDAAVIGIPHPEYGEVPKAFLVTNDKSISAEEIHQFIKNRVSSYKYLLGGISFCDNIPKSGSGKILRRKLRDGGRKSKL